MARLVAGFEIPPQATIRKPLIFSEVRGFSFWSVVAFVHWESLRMPNTLCPYSTAPRSACGEINAEHVVPSALGAPDSFTVPCSATENSSMNERIDAPFLNMSMMKLIAASQGVSSRSGGVIAQLRGAVQATGDAVNVTLGEKRC